MNPYQEKRVSPVTMFSGIWSNRKLAVQMCKREVLGRYRGSIFGLAWSFFTPLLMLAVYTFFFTVVFKARWGVSQDSSHANFAVVLFVGLIVHGLFSECLSRAPSLIQSNATYVKKVVFPLEIFPWIAMGAALFHMSISVFILLVAQLVLSGTISWTVILFPLVLLPFLLLTMGFSWFLSATGVFVRDIGQTIGLLMSVLLFVSPVFYPISSLPAKVQKIVMLNPLTLIIEESRNVLLYSKLPNWGALAIYAIISMILAWVGFWWFQKARKGFADVL
jgi:lipopolysaccharide transport system permease protein